MPKHTKRLNGEGTIYKDKSGLWRAEVTIGYDASGKRLSRKKASADIAVVQKWLNDERARLNRGIIVHNSDYTVESWLTFWLNTYKRATIKARTYDLYEALINNHIIPQMGAVKLSKARGEHIQSIYNDMHKKGLSTSTIHNLNIPLSQAFEQAIKNELIYINPCKNVVVPKKAKRESRAFTKEEQNAFNNALTDSTYCQFFAFAFATGMRCGEIMALTWSDINLGDGMITVNKTLSTIVDRDENAAKKTKTVFESPKTNKSNRTVPITPSALKSLDVQRGKEGCKNFVFAASNGSPLMYRNLKRAFDAHIKKCSLPNDLTIHSTRHSFATRLLEKGASPKVVSELLGHSSIQITLDVYSHVLPDLKRETIMLLE